MSKTTPSFDPTSLKDNLDIANSAKAAVGTKSTGGTGGTEFTLTQQEHAVTKIKVWTDTGSNTSAGNWSDRDLVKDIELTWDDGTTSNITGNHKGNWVDFRFHDNEKVTSMTINTGGRVDKISFVTDKEEDGKYRAFSAGQDHGSAHTQTVGKGVLYGFHGSYDKTEKELISLGTTFKS